MLTTAQIAERMRGLFATDAAPALGLSKYSTPVQLWMEKTGKAEPADLSGIEAVQMGTFMEPHIATLYADRMDVRVRYIGDYTQWHPSIEWMGSHFDYVVDDGQNTLVEIKNFSQMRRKEFGENGSGDVPMDVLMQCIHEAEVYGTDSVHVAVLFGGQEFAVFPLNIELEAKTKLISLENEFWCNFVIADTPPEPRTLEETKALFARDNGETANATPEIESAVQMLRDVKSGIEQLQAKEDELKVFIQTYMHERAELVDSTGQKLATWKKSKDGMRFNADLLKEQMPGIHARFMVQQTGTRRFLIK